EVTEAKQQVDVPVLARGEVADQVDVAAPELAIAVNGHVAGEEAGRRDHETCRADRDRVGERASQERVAARVRREAGVEGALLKDKATEVDAPGVQAVEPGSAVRLEAEETVVVEAVGAEQDGGVVLA